jgi:CheY-like chemotaxis protein
MEWPELRRPPRVLIADDDLTRASHLARWLEGAGYRVLLCPGPDGPTFCHQEAQHGCLIWLWVDLVIYHAWVPKSRWERSSDDLVASLRKHLPDRPLILAGESTVTPTWVARFAANDPRTAAVFPVNRQSLLEAVGRLLAGEATARSR